MPDKKELLEKLEPEVGERIARHFQDGAFVFDLDSESHTLREGNTVYHVCLLYTSDAADD